MIEESSSAFRGSPQQEEQWRREPDGPSRRVQAIVRFHGGLDPDALKDALCRVVERHESLRTTFAHQPGMRIPLQVVNDTLPPHWEMRTAVGGDRERQLAEALASEGAASLNFADGPLVRGLLIAFGAEHHELLVTVSALCADPASITQLVAELAHHYGAPTQITEDPLQYADFSAWQLELSESGDEEGRAARER